ncbi:MAG: hypothetical protein HQ546_05880 [Planctomycetes bacterium]|nr:hypothetical protein [Planctomycetota bacterium]
MIYKTMKQRLEAMNYRQPPYSTRYPGLAELTKYYDSDAGVPPEGNTVLRNICVGKWLEVRRQATLEMIDVRGDNLTEQSPGFVNAGKGDFRLRADSQALKLGFKPNPMEEIGLIQDQYRPGKAKP